MTYVITPKVGLQFSSKDFERSTLSNTVGTN